MTIGPANKGLSWEQEKHAVDKAITDHRTKWGNQFGLKAYPDEVFEVSRDSSYFSSEWGVMLYTRRLCESGVWKDFIKGTPDELDKETIKLKKKTSKRKKCQGYRFGVMWIGENDNPGDNHCSTELAGYISVMLLADLFDCCPEQVAEDVVRYRLKNMPHLGVPDVTEYWARRDAGDHQ